MRKLFLGLGVSLSLFATASVHADAINNTDFVMTWRTTTANEQIIIPIVGGNYNIDCNNDGDATDPGDSTGVSGDGTCTFTTAGDHTVRLSGSFPQINFFHGISNWNQSNRDKLISIDQWGTNVWISMEQAFYKCRNLELNALDIPNLNDVTNMKEMFQGASNLGGPSSMGNWNWDTSNVTNMEAMFSLTTSFNQPISNFNTSNVTNMAGMFSHAEKFNQSLNFDTSSVTDMRSMFFSASSFNQPLNFDTSSVTNMRGMFAGAIDFNQPLSFNTSMVSNMESMFAGAINFNQPLNFDTASTRDFSNMFLCATEFNQDISNFNIAEGMSFGNYFFTSGTLFHPDCDKISFSTENYDKLLVSFNDQQPTGRTNLELNVHTVSYCSQAAADARQNLIDTYGWTITDGGRNCTPTDITLSGSTVSENTALVGNLATVYPGDHLSHTYTLVSGTGSEDNGLFQIDGSGSLSFQGAPDYENPTDTGDTAGNNTYSIRVQTEDTDGNTFQRSFIITVTDVVETLDLTLNGDATITLELGETFTAPGTTCTNAGCTVTQTGSIDTMTPGSYTLTYTGTDAGGNTGSISRTIQVVDTTDPTITLNGETTMTLQLGETFTDPGATCADAQSCMVTQTGSVDTEKAGTYTITYTATDGSGNTDTVTRTVIVAPITGTGGGGGGSSGNVSTPSSEPSLNAAPEEPNNDIPKNTEDTESTTDSTPSTGNGNQGSIGGGVTSNTSAASGGAIRTIQARLGTTESETRELIAKLQSREVSRAELKSIVSLYLQRKNDAENTLKEEELNAAVEENNTDTAEGSTLEALPEMLPQTGADIGMEAINPFVEAQNFHDALRKHMLKK